MSVAGNRLLSVAELVLLSVVGGDGVSTGFEAVTGAVIIADTCCAISGGGVGACGPAAGVAASDCVVDGSPGVLVAADTGSPELATSCELSPSVEAVTTPTAAGTLTPTALTLEFFSSALAFQ